MDAFKTEGVSCSIAAPTTGESQHSSRRLYYREQAEEDLQRLINVLPTLNHPNIVKVHQCSLQGKHIFQVVEDFCDGGCLAAHIDKINGINTMQSISLAVQYLHQERRMLHSHLSLQCVFWKDGVVVVGGVSLEPNMFNQSGIRSMDQIQPPESLEGQYGYGSDIWSLGIVFLQLLLKRRLKQKLSLPEWLNLIEDTQLKELISKMLNPQPNLRPSIQDILAAQNSAAGSSKKTPSQIVHLLLKETEAFWLCKVSNKKLEKLHSDYFSVIEKQAIQGNPTAMYLAGRIFQTSKRDALAAKEWFLKALNAGECRAYVNLGILEEAEGIVDENFLRKSCELNDNRGLWVMGRLLRKGYNGKIKNFEEALRTVQLVSNDYPKSKEDLAWLTAKSQNSVIEYPREVSHFLEEGAKLGDKKSMEALSDCLDDQDKPKQAIKIALIALKAEGSGRWSHYRMLNLVGVLYGKCRDRLNMRRLYTASVKEGCRLAKKNINKVGLF